MEEEKYMWRCIQLAQNGLCSVAPNPMVGAVIVCDGKIIGEGYHVRYGEAHAEVNAIRSVKDASLLKRSTIYVTLEPCSHYGKTPPCADLIIEKQIPRIVIGCRDPFPEVAGRGIQKLKDVGRDVSVGILEEECRCLIRRFVTFHTFHRPYITLKWAESADGFIDLCRNSGSPVMLSTPLTSMLVHKKRSEHAAILVGTHTAELDNPSLTVRNWYGASPVRIVLDRKQRLLPTLHLFDGNVPTFVFTAQPHAGLPNVEYLRIDFQQDILPQIMQILYERGLQSLLVEGGSTLLQSFIDSDLWDEVFIEKSPVLLASGVKAPKMSDKISYVGERSFGRSFLHYRATKQCELLHIDASLSEKTGGLSII
ncbi:bifunctional diaminohydroxyphosphoribosylaminopyrimidine deaminase/5-amino-6-(5-phosphoribosylamino)uracil reductase RibD [Bacteroides sp. UBA939]|uniref:bifunctional diaminohydroxyphosphoribosylaminopyrimidine deaminase/5-amino-6-(5-phosphoribosylamino)uracil reductase RibD n=1 Tax=Bacteroides sp. UBA939 TaxID=1946092 RepID=UPI0025C63E3F|nr:bifunctional diaminohydroxyphosphoribosylaminopyrimidine deaminase/5-amino-6-(5-phosphoribosylamino)uracil reductase RibD [Bacteroides sp. UBA939]